MHHLLTPGCAGFEPHSQIKKQQMLSMYPLTETEMLKATVKFHWNSVRLYKICPEMKFIYDTKTEITAVETFSQETSVALTCCSSTGKKATPSVFICLHICLCAANRQREKPWKTVPSDSLGVSSLMVLTRRKLSRFQALHTEEERLAS